MDNEILNRRSQELHQVLVVNIKASRRLRRAGLTLIEVMVVVLIISILVAVP